MKTRVDKRIVKLDFFFPKIALFGHMLKKIITFTFWCMVIFVHSEGPKGFVN